MTNIKNLKLHVGIYIYACYLYLQLRNTKKSLIHVNSTRFFLKIKIKSYYVKLNYLAITNIKSTDDLWT